MKKFILSGLLLVVCSLAISDENWIDIGGNDDLDGAILKNSFAVQTNKGGVEVAVVTTRTLWKKTKEVDLGKMYVPTQDCRNKQGKIVTLTMDNTFRYENDFIFGAGSVAANRAEWICAVYFYSVKERENKGL